MGRYWRYTSHEITMTKISFVYFDVGGVVIKDFTDTPKWRDMQTYIGITDEQFMQFEQIYNALVSDIARGKIPTDTVVENFLSQTKIPLPNGFSLQEYFLENFERNELIWPIISIVKEKYRIGLLTDMFNGLFDGIKVRGLYPNIKWEVIIDSSVVGFKKPMPEIYEIAANKVNVPPNEILFIDNVQKNLDGAKLAGWQTYRYDSSNYEKSSHDLLDFFSQMI